MPDRRMQFSLGTGFLLLAAISIVVAQLRIQQAKQASVEAWRQSVANNVMSPLDLRWDYADRTMGIFNIVAFCAGAYFFFRRSRLSGLWVGIVVAGIGTALATVMGAVG